VDLRTWVERVIEDQESERRRIARELHDDVVQRTAAIEIELTRLHETLDPADVMREALRLLTGRVAELSDSLREISHRLYPASLGDLGIHAAFQSLVDWRRRDGWDVTLVLHAVPDALPFRVCIALYRIAEEALRNAGRHAPGAPVRIKLGARGKLLTLAVHDAGPGFNFAAASGQLRFGLLGMQARASLAGGRLLVRTHPGRGTSVVVRIPLAG
jgi:signal transduction histidine kinase